MDYFYICLLFQIIIVCLRCVLSPRVLALQATEKQIRTCRVMTASPDLTSRLYSSLDKV